MGPVPPGRDRGENVNILFRALRDPSNRELLPQIERALKLAGFSDNEIKHYQITGRHLSETPVDPFEELKMEMEGLKDELDGKFDGFNTLRRHAQTMKRRRVKALKNLIFIFILSMLLLFMVVLLSLDDKDESVPPPMTEATGQSVSDGDKL